MIACYCRVSTSRQRTDSQRAEIENWLKGNGVKLESVHWYLDHESGSNTDRIALSSMQKAIFAGRVKTVVVWKLDRVSRRLQDGINLIADWCNKGVRVVSVTQQIDLSGPVGRMLASVLFGLAEIDLEHMRERRAAGIRLAKQRNVYRGRKKGTTKAKPERARQLDDQGLTANEIATALGVSERTVFRYLAQTSA